MKLAFLVLAVSFGATQAKDVVRGGGRALQGEFSMSSDLTTAGFQAGSPGPTTSKSGKQSKGQKYCLPADACDGIEALFEEKGCVDAIQNNPFDECYTLSALEELALELIPNCVLLWIYGQITWCGVGNDYALSDSASSGGAAVFGVKMEDFNDFARANLPEGFTS